MKRKTLGEQLREARISARLSQVDLAKKSGVTLVTITRLETGNNRVQFKTIRSLEKSLNCKFDIQEADIYGVGKGYSSTSWRGFDSLRNKIRAMEPDDVLEFPGHGALAQRIRVSLRKDREVNQRLPDVIVNLHK